MFVHRILEEEINIIFSFVPLYLAEALCGGWVKFKSLILAQDERWRRG